MRENTRMKKVLSVLLCLCMVLSYVPNIAFAVTLDDIYVDDSLAVAESQTVGNVSIDKTASLIIAEGVTLTVTGNLYIDSGTLDNFGTLIVHGTIYLARAKITNQSGGTISFVSNFENPTGCTITNYGTFSVGGDFQNNGTFTNSGGTITVGGTGACSSPHTYSTEDVCVVCGYKEERQLFVKLSDGSGNFTISAYLSGTVQEAKEAILAEKGYLVAQQQLSYNNQILEDNKTLASYGIVKDSTLTLTLLEAESYNLWIGGVEVTSAKTSGEGWSYDQATNTLTLNGASITSGSYAEASIYATDALNIVLAGSNTISGTNYGIYAESSVSISGSDSLTVTGHFDGIQAHGAVTINSGTVTFTGESSYGIKAEGNTLTFNGGYVKANGGASGSGVVANTIVLSKAAHVAVAHNSNAIAGTLSAESGICRTEDDGKFTDTIAADGAYFEYIGANHIIYTYKDEKNHTVSCVHNLSFDEMHKYDEGTCICNAEDPMYGCDFIVTGDAENYTWDKTNKVLTINGGNVTVSNKDKNTATTHRIYIQGTANVTLDGVNISTNTGAPIEIRDYSDTNVTLTLNGSNTLISKADGKAAIHKSRGQQGTSSNAATLTITGSGSLTAVGGNDAAGIGGGGYRGDTHNIIINGGTINAQGNGDAAGIGSSDDGSTWNIVINGGNITANGKPGIGANTTNTQGQQNAAITGGMVIANSYKGSTPTGGLVSTDGGQTYTVHGDYTLTQDLTIASNGKLTVEDGAELTVAGGATLTNGGILENKGTISGNLDNEGTIYNKGTLPANVGGSVYEQYVKVNNGSGTGTYAEGSTVTITADAPASGKMFTGWTVELGEAALADSSKAETTFTMPSGCVIVTANYADIVATVTDANGNVTPYSDNYRAQEAWYTYGGTLTLYTDSYNLHGAETPPENGVLDLNGHRAMASMWQPSNSITIKNGTLLVYIDARIASDVVVTFENVTVKGYSYGSEPVEITNYGTIIDSGMTLDGVTINGGTVKTALKDSNIALTDIPAGGFVYSGIAQEPGVKCGETALVKGTDYTVTFSHSDGSSNPVNAGTVTMTITGIGNYSGTVIKTYDIGIADPGIGAVTAGVVNDTLEASAIVLTRANTSVAGNLIVDAGQTLVLGVNTITYTFIPTDTNYKSVTGTVTVTVADTIAPTGTVSIATNRWTNFLNNITFGLFFKETQTVSVTANDNLSGVAKIEYIESSTAMDLAAVQMATQWTELKNGSVSVTLEDTKQFIYYIRITDKSGNVTYLSSDGAEYDTSAPVIGGVANGATYYTSRAVTVTDKNLDTVTVNGAPVTGSITLEGDKEATYTIVATDKAGNSATVTVTMKPIRTLAEATSGLTHDNVTSEDAPALEALIEKLDELLADENVSDDGERETLEQHKAIAESLLQTIEDADKATDTENTDKVEDVTADNVTPDDKSDLEKAKADLEKALEDNSGNYTEEEKKAIEDELKRIDDALKVIENVEGVEDAVSDLPATFEPDDEETVAKIEEAKKAYDELTDYEKSLVDPETKEKLDKLTNGISAYDIVKGDGSSWTQGTDGTISFTVNGPVSKFSGIKIDGKAVDAQHYEVKAGSTIITLKASYLETLAAGEHTITVVYTDGETSGTFKVQAKSTTPATGDDTNILLWTTMLFVSLVAMAVLVIGKKSFFYKAKYARK